MYTTTTLHKVDLIVHSNASNLAAIGCEEVFNVANSVLGFERYLVTVYPDAEHYFDRLGYISKKNETETIIFVGAIDGQWCVNNRHHDKLRLLLVCGSRIGLVGNGVFLAAKSRVLCRSRLAVHANFRAIFEEEFCDHEYVTKPCWIDGQVFSATGGGAAIRMASEMLRIDFGDQFHSMVESFLGLEQNIVEAYAVEKMQWAHRSRRCKIVSNCIDEMHANIETPISMPELARRVGVSARQVERLFRGTLNEPPIQVYKTIRLEQARRFVLDSQMPLIEVGIAHGFFSHTSFARSYRILFGVTPSQERRNLLDSGAGERTPYHSANVQGDSGEYNFRIVG